MLDKALGFRVSLRLPLGFTTFSGAMLQICSQTRENFGNVEMYGSFDDSSENTTITFVSCVLSYNHP